MGDEWVYRPPGDHIVLMQGNKEIARWKAGEFPSWIAQYLDRFPNTEVTTRFRLVEMKTGKHIIVPPGYLAVKVYAVLLNYGLA